MVDVENLEDSSEHCCSRLHVATYLPSFLVQDDIPLYSNSFSSTETTDDDIETELVVLHDNIEDADDDIYVGDVTDDADAVIDSRSTMSCTLVSLPVQYR